MELLTLADREAWQQAHAAGGLPSQSWRYAAALTDSGLAPELAVVSADGGTLLLPHVRRGGPGAESIVTLPGLSGAAFLPAARAAPLRHWGDYARERGWVAGYLQLAAGTDVAALAAGDELVERTTTFLLDARRWTLRGSASTIVRRKVAAALRAGAEIIEDRPVLARALPALYATTQQRYGAGVGFSEATIAGWVADPGNVVVGAAIGGIPQAIQLWQVDGAAAELHLVGSTEAGRELSALLFDHALSALAARDIAVANLGGAGDPQGGLYRFKTWLGAQPSPLHALHQVYDAAAYARLCAGKSASGRFPAYLG